MIGEIDVNDSKQGAEEERTFN